MGTVTVAIVRAIAAIEIVVRSTVTGTGMKDLGAGIPTEVALIATTTATGIFVG